MSIVSDDEMAEFQAETKSGMLVRGFTHNAENTRVLQHRRKIEIGHQCESS